MRTRNNFVLAAIYDTETCNIGTKENARAYPILFIDNDIRDVDIYNYTPDKDDKINFYRYETDYIERIKEYIDWGKILGVVPIICAYNLMFDLQPLMETLNETYEIRANAQSSTNVYTLDLYSDENIVLRFWDTYHLEMRGLQAMGKTAGLKKATGDWNYNLIRTAETELTELELFYARRDVQVIPAYLSYLLRANEWMVQSDLGFRVITKTSLVRQMARHEIERLTVPKQNGKKLELRWAFMRLCKKELPPNYGIYALRKACFRGGFTFTSARYALTLQKNVVSADVTSMHHTFINGRYVPQDFRAQTPRDLEVAFNSVIETDLNYILAHYEKPFKYAFHARIRFRNVKIRKGTCFEDWGIALESTSKFKRVVESGTEFGLDPRAVAQENAVRSGGWLDTFNSAVFAFGKMYEADEVVMHLNELELWTFSRVYQWDSLEPIFGEITQSFKLPPDFVTLQSNKLYEQKNAAKFILFHYEKGVPYPYDTEYMPDGIALALRDGTLEPQFFEEWYSSTVKGQFNGIYGTQAQDVFKPTYKCVDGELTIDETTITTEENYEERKPNNTRVLYTYGMRIVGGSRMHMVIALELLYNSLKNRVRVLGGDTDSMKISCDNDVSDDDLERALEPIAKASKEAINRCMFRLRQNFPQFASKLTGIGGFELENKGKHYSAHYEMWNKARISYDGKHVHITCAGLPRPIGMYTIETFMDDLIANGNTPEKVLTQTLGFNTYISHEIAHTLEHRKPKATDIFDRDVTDYLGNTTHVVAHESTALYPSERWLGETVKITNSLTVKYLNANYNRDVEEGERYLRFENGRAKLYQDTPTGTKLIMEGILRTDN